MQFTILIIDDDPANLRVISALLRDEHKVVIAKTANNALTIAEKTNPDLILLDLLMPDISGFDIINQLKNNALTNATPVIVMSGLDPKHVEELSLRLGASDFIHKPFHPDVFNRRVQRQLQNQQHINQLNQVTYYDAITALPNRLKYDQDIERIADELSGTPDYLAIGMLSVNGLSNQHADFSAILDDKLLCAIAKACGIALGQHQAFLYHTSINEFIFVTHHKEHNHIDQLLTKLQSMLQNDNCNSTNTTSLNNVIINGGVSIHRCNVPLSTKIILEQAAELMYKGKQQDKSTLLSSYFFTEYRKTHDI